MYFPQYYKFTFYCVWVLLIYCCSCKSTYLSDNDIVYKDIERLQRDNSTNNRFLKAVKNGVFTSSNAEAFLIKYFKRTQSGGTIQFSDSSEEDKKELLKTVLEQYKRYIKSPYPTRYQDPLTYLIYAPIFERIQRSANVVYPYQNVKAKYGTFYSHSTILEQRSENNNYITLIHQNYVAYCHQMGKVALQTTAIPEIMNDPASASYKFENAARLIDQNRLIRANFTYTFLEFKRSDLPPNKNLAVHTDYFLKALQYWNNSSELFVMAHEYAHALLAHKLPESDRITDTVLLKSWYNEIDADLAGQKILNQTVKENGSKAEYLGWSKYCLAGGIFYLNALHSFELCNHLFEQGDEEPVLSSLDQQTILEILKDRNDFDQNIRKFSTLAPFYRSKDHPPTVIRIKMLEESIKDLWASELSQNDTVNQVDNANGELAKYMLSGLQYMYSRSRDILIGSRNIINNSNN